MNYSYSTRLKQDDRKVPNCMLLTQAQPFRFCTLRHCALLKPGVGETVLYTDSSNTRHELMLISQRYLGYLYRYRTVHTAARFTNYHHHAHAALLCAVRAKPPSAHPSACISCPDSMVHVRAIPGLSRTGRICACAAAWHPRWTVQATAGHMGAKACCASRPRHGLVTWTCICKCMAWSPGHVYAWLGHLDRGGVHEAVGRGGGDWGVRVRVRARFMLLM